MTDKRCPACGGELIIVPPSTKADVASWIMLVAGIFLTPILIGIVLIIIALTRGFTTNTDAYYKCLSCYWDNLSYTWEPTVSEDGTKIYQPASSNKYTSLIIVLLIVLVIIVPCLICGIISALTPSG